MLAATMAPAAPGGRVHPGGAPCRFLGRAVPPTGAPAADAWVVSEGGRLRAGLVSRRQLTTGGRCVCSRPERAGPASLPAAHRRRQGLHGRHTGGGCPRAGVVCRRVAREAGLWTDGAACGGRGTRRWSTPAGETYSASGCPSLFPTASLLSMPAQDV